MAALVLLLAGTGSSRSDVTCCTQDPAPGSAVFLNLFHCCGLHRCRISGPLASHPGTEPRAQVSRQELCR